MFSKWTALIFAIALILPVMACGRKGDPVPPPDSDYPRTYPSR